MFEKRLSQREIDQILKKIKNKYEEYSKKYGKKFFPYHGFRERYLEFISDKRSPIPIEVFLFAEIEALEDRKNEIDEKIEKRKRAKELEKEMEKRGEELLKKIASYPEDDFHTDASLEIKKLVAIFKVIYEELDKYFYDIHSDYKEVYRREINLLKDFVIQPYSGNFSNYIRELKHPFKDMNKIEVIEQFLVKDLGIAMNTFITLLKKTEGGQELLDFIQILEKISGDFRLSIFKPLVK